MLKITICDDPLFYIKNRADKIQWDAASKDDFFAHLLDLVRQNKSFSIAYGEYLFDDDAKAVTLLETLDGSTSDITLFCRDAALPAPLMRYAAIETLKPDLSIFSAKISSLPFSENTKNTIRENLKGFPFSRIDDLLDAVAKFEENQAVEYVLQSKRSLLMQNEILEVINVGDGISGIGGYDELKQWITERRNNFSEEARKFGIPMPKGMLMLGVQGCGKSLTSKVISNIWNFPLVRLDFINLFRKGQSVEELLKSAIATIEGFAPVVLWIDEIEKALSQEGEGAEIRRVLGWLMTWMQEKTEPVFLVATANRVSLLPPELLRKGRFDEIFFVDLPSKPEREEIFKIHLKKRGRNPEEFDTDKLARNSEGFSGAEIEQTVIDSLITAYSRNCELTQKILEEILRRTVPLSKTYEENIKELRIWSRNRARNASGNRKIESYFGN